MVRKLETKRILSLLLALTLVLGYLPAPAFAAESDGLCPHHTSHEGCGYVAEADCNHKHGEGCSDVSSTVCIHVHGEDGCTYQEGREAVLCHVCSEEACGYVAGNSCECDLTEGKTHVEGCGYVAAADCTRPHGEDCGCVAAVEASGECGHVCSAESGCVTTTFVCVHTSHDEACGFSGGSVCTHVCQQCKDQEAAEAVRVLIAALPEVEAAAAMSNEELGGWNEAIQSAYSAYAALNEEQKAQLTAEGEKLKGLLNCLNDPSRIMTTDEVAHTHDDIQFSPWIKSDTLPTSGNYYLTDEITLSSNVTLSGNLNLCLNGYDVKTEGKPKITIASGQTLEIFDCKNTGTCSLVFLNEGTLNIYGGTYEKYGTKGSYAYLIDNKGSLYIANAAIKTDVGVIKNTGTLTIASGSLESTSSSTNDNCVYNQEGGTVTISGGKFKSSGSRTIYAGSGQMTINSGTFTNSGNQNVVFVAVGTCTINSGTFQSSGAATIQASTSAGTMVEIKGGNFTSGAGQKITDLGNFATSATIKISGGTFTTTGSIATVDVTKGQLSGGTFTNGIQAKYKLSEQIATGCAYFQDGSQVTPGTSDKKIDTNTVTVQKISNTFDVAVADTTNGTVTAPTSAAAGDTVTLTVTPVDGYELETLTYTPEGGEATNITATEGVYSFSMPAADVTVTATFKERKAIVLKIGGTEVGTYDTLYDLWYDKLFNQTVASDIEIIVSENVDCGAQFETPAMGSGTSLTIKSAEGGSFTVSNADIWVKNGATLCLENITLKGASGDYQIISVDNGTLNIGSDATIQDGDTMAIYAAILLQPVSGETATLNMSGGTIRNCVRGVFLDESYGGTVAFNMTDGSITGNGVTFGWGGVLVGEGASFTMTGGSITNNTVAGYGNGGITLNGGGNLTIGGSAQVTGNGNANIKLQQWDTSVFTVQEGFTGKVGVNSDSTISGTSKKPVTVAGSTGYQEAYIGTNIVPDQSQYELICENNALYLVVHSHKWVYTGSETGNTITVTCESESCDYHTTGLPLTCDASGLNQTYNGKQISVMNSDYTSKVQTTGLTELVTASKYYYYGLSYYFEDQAGTKYPYNPKNAGEYFYVMTLVDNGNGKAVLAEARSPFTISPAELTVTAEDHTIVYGEVPVGNGVSITGFVNNETESVVTTTGLAYDFNYTAGDPVGTYTITPKGLSAKNYTFTYVPGTLTVNAKTLNDSAITLEPARMDFGKEPTITVKDGDKTLTKVTDYTVTYEDSDGTPVDDLTAVTTDGIYTAVITGTGNYTGTVRETFVLTDDTTAPSITGITNGNTYYTTQKVTVSDENLTEVNGGAVTGTTATVTLDGNRDERYSVTAKDIAGNTTAISITMKPISSLDDAIEALTAENVTFQDQEAIENVLETVTGILDNECGNATEAEKEALDAILAKCNALLEILGNAQEVIDLIAALPEADKVIIDSKEHNEAYEAAQKAYNTLIEDEQRLVGNKDKLDAVKKALTNYKIIKGDGSRWLRGSGKSLSFTANGYFGKFTHIEVDGEVVDAKHYTAQSGSTVVTLKSSYLETLRTRKHTIQFFYEDGKTNEATFRIYVNGDNPMTGENSDIFLFGGMLMGSTMLLAVALILSKKFAYKGRYRR